MKALIIEDEKAAVTNLKAILKEVAPQVRISGVLDSIRSTVEYLNTHEMPDLMFMDIQLSDGESFTIFEKAQISCPVIFTTAYDSYALEAFKVNSIDYLLKPIEPEQVQRALDKLLHLSGTDLESYLHMVREVFKGDSHYHRTLLINYRDKMIPLPVNQIAYFYTKDEATTVVTISGKEWPVDKTLDSLYSVLDPDVFFRANRQFLVSHSSIREVVIWFGNRLSLNLEIDTPERIIISKAKVASFKRWITRNDSAKSRY